MQLAETAMLTSCSDYLIFYRDQSTRRKAFDAYLRVIEEAVSAGIRPICDLEDVTRADIDGFVVPFVQKLMSLSASLPEHLKVKVALCDTLGFGLSTPGVALPRSIPKLIYRMTHDAGVPSDRLEWHGHNDFHRVHINAFTCWLYGANAVNASLLGIGERTGNPPLEGAIVDFVGLKGNACGADLRIISEIADVFRRDIRYHIPPNYPFVGHDFNVTRAGIHASGLRRDERVYNIFDTTHVLGRPPRVAITDKSGVDGVALWVNHFLGLKGSEQLSKIDVIKVARWVVDQYEVEGRTTAVSDEEMAEQVRLHLPTHHRRAMARRAEKGQSAGAKAP
jgi:isopropylmalate/homocitrate/citramalate synthase